MHSAAVLSPAPIIGIGTAFRASATPGSPAQLTMIASKPSFHICSAIATTFGPPHRHGSIIVDSIRLIRDTAGLVFQEWEILFDQSAMELEQFRISRGQDADQPHPVLFHGDHPFADKILFI